jgi:hypothetical protein
MGEVALALKAGWKLGCCVVGSGSGAVSWPSVLRLGTEDAVDR